ncbi:MAG: hypothetical protein WDA08_11135 [Weeksellaceae bacterium]
MKNLLIPVKLLLFFIWFFASSFSSTPAWERDSVSFPMMNQEIRHTMQEDERQTDMHKKQITATGAELHNRTQWDKLKKVKRDIENRLSAVSFALQAIPAGIVITNDINDIIESQTDLIELMTNHPFLVIMLPDEITFLEDAQEVVALMIGIIASYGIINQMEKAERKILLDYALAEVKRLKQTSKFLLFLAKEEIRMKNLTIAIWQTVINQDKEIVQDILDNF